MRVIAPFLVFLVLGYSSAQFLQNRCQGILIDIVANTSADISGLRDIHGKPVLNRADAVGMTYPFCLSRCGVGFEKTNFTTAISQMGTWFFPYFQILAQIPMQTESIYGDIQVLLYTIGSPLTTLYNIFLSHFNWRWLHELMDEELRANAIERTVLINDIELVLGKLQQFPLVAGDSLLLASALVLPENRSWWRKLSKSLVNLEKRLDGPAVAQITLAIVTYVFSVVQALGDIGGIPPVIRC
jgi:hypothetical protein